MFRIVPEVEPYAWMLSNSVDCRNKPLPPYAGNLAFMLPVKDEKPSHHALRIKLCHGTTDHDCEGNSQTARNNTIRIKYLILARDNNVTIKHITLRINNVIIKLCA